MHDRKNPNLVPVYGRPGYEAWRRQLLREGG